MRNGAEKSVLLVMKVALPLVLILASCGAPPLKEPEDLVLLVDLMGRGDAFHREEAAYRLSIAGERIPEVLEGRERALEFAEGDLATMRQRLNFALNVADPERQVRLSWHALRLGCLARDWSRVYDSLTRQGCRLIEIYEPNERIKFVRLMLQTGAYSNDAHDRHDLFCWLQSVKADGGRWRVREVYVGLHVRFDAPFKTVSASPRYGRNEILQKFLDLPELQKVAIVFPFLEEIEFTYGRIRENSTVGAPAGFHVNAGFVMDAKADGRSVYYTAEAGQDPRELDRGRLDWDNYSPSVDIGPLTPRGSGVWGAGGLRPVEEY
jgi:hypothetical protein